MSEYEFTDKAMEIVEDMGNSKLGKAMKEAVQMNEITPQMPGRVDVVEIKKPLVDAYQFPRHCVIPPDFHETIWVKYEDHVKAVAEALERYDQGVATYRRTKPTSE